MKTTSAFCIAASSVCIIASSALAVLSSHDVVEASRINEAILSNMHHQSTVAAKPLPQSYVIRPVIKHH